MKQTKAVTAIRQLEDSRRAGYGDENVEIVPTQWQRQTQELMSSCNCSVFSLMALS